MDLPTSNVSKNQKPPQNSLKLGFSVGEFKKRKFDKNSKGSEWPRPSQPPQSV